MRPGREHDTTAAWHPQALPLLAEWTDETHGVLADLSYEDERRRADHPGQAASRPPADHQPRTVKLMHAATRAPAQRGNSPLKNTFKVLRRVSLCPVRIGAITAALVLLHHKHGRAT